MCKNYLVEKTILLIPQFFGRKNLQFFCLLLVTLKLYYINYILYQFFHSLSAICESFATKIVCKYKDRCIASSIDYRT